MVTITALDNQTYAMPPSLNNGDKIAILAPATHIKEEYVLEACRFLESRGFRTEITPHCLGNVNDYSGTIEQRYSDMRNAFTDTETRAILCARGGYGVVHFIDRFNPDFLRDNAKWLIGFSDITALHAMMLHAGVASLHAPMAKYMYQNPESNSFIDRQLAILSGNHEALSHCQWDDDELNVHGVAEGSLVGGNMAVFNGLNGSPFDFNNIESPILFIEDVGEEVYKIERMLYNMKLNGFLSHIKALIVGQFTEYDKTRNAETMEQMIYRMVKDYGIPMSFNAPFGHGEENIPLIEGQRIRLTV